VGAEVVATVVGGGGFEMCVGGEVVELYGALSYGVGHVFLLATEGWMLGVREGWLGLSEDVHEEEGVGSGQCGDLSTALRFGRDDRFQREWRRSMQGSLHCASHEAAMLRSR